MMFLLRAVVILTVVCECAAADCVLRGGSVLRVVLAEKVTPKPDAILTGQLDRPVYNGACQALPQGVRVRAVVARIEKQHAKHAAFAWVARLNGAEAIPPSVILRSAQVELADGTTVPLAAHFVRLASERHREAGAKPQRDRRRVLLLESDGPMSVPASAPDSHPPADGVVPAGTAVRVDLAGPIHSGRTRVGDVLQARVAEPVVIDGHTVVPEGAMIEAVIAQARGARRMYRPGHVRLSFRSLLLPNGRHAEVSLSTSAGELSHATRFDAEGGLTGGPASRKRMLLNLGVAYATGKVLDDLVEEGAKAALGAAVAGSAATAARYVGLGTGALAFLLHRGHDVTLDPHTELELTFSRDLDLRP